MNHTIHEPKRRRPHAQVTSRRSTPMPERSRRAAPITDAVVQDAWMKMVQTFVKLELG
jgi:hypothetical protein